MTLIIPFGKPCMIVFSVVSDPKFQFFLYPQPMQN